MNKYELMYIISSDATEEQREALIEKYKAFVESKGGVVNGVDKLGMKKFAYKINFKTEGFYVLMNFEANAEVVSEMNKNMNIADLVVRQMFVRK
ncbi:MAG: 30S ribosomal protein S6 [Clostridiales bacterium]|nr:30S ribosomal protein S6 [Clostridiales bacterium]